MEPITRRADVQFGDLPPALRELVEEACAGHLFIGDITAERIPGQPACTLIICPLAAGETLRDALRTFLAMRGATT